MTSKDEPTEHAPEQRRSVEAMALGRPIPSLAALAVSAEALAEVFRHAPILMTLSTIQDGRCLDVNDMFEQVSGFTREEAAGRTSQGLGWITPEDRLRLEQELQAKGCVRGMELNLTAKDGRQINCLYDGEIIRMGDQAVLLSLARDITEVTQAQGALQESETRFSDVIEKAQAGYFRIGPDGCFQHVNRAWLNMHGYDSLDEIVGQHYSLTQVEADLDAATGIVDKIQVGDTPSIGTFSRRRKDGSVGYHTYSANPVTGRGEHMGLEGFLIDVTDQVLAEKALRDSEERYRGILEATQDGFWITDLQGHLLQVNAAYCAMSGYTEQELLAMGIVDLEVDESVAAIATRIRKITAAGSDRFETRHRRKDGSIFSVETSAQCWPKNGNSIITFVRDVTERQELESTVQLSQERFRKAFVGAPYPILIHAEDGAVLAVNDAWTETSGYSLEDIPTMEAWAHKAHPGEQAFVVAHNQALYGITQRVVEGEYQIRRKSGELRLWEFASSPLEQMPDGRRVIISMARDVTSHREVEEALRLKSDELERYFTESLDLLCIADTEGYFHRLNPAWEQVLGYPVEEMKGRRFLDLVHPEDLPATLSTLAILGGQQEVAVFTNRYQCKDGSYRWIEWRSHPMGGLIYATARDVTEQRKLEAVLKASEEKYRRLFETMKEGFALHEIITDEHGQPVDYRYLDVNPAFEALTGLPREQWIGRTVMEVIPQTEPYWIETYGHVALTGEPARIENYSAPLGRWYQVFAYCPYPKQFAVLVVDVTERKLAEEALRKSEAQLRTLIDTIPDLVWLKDLSGVYQYCNNRFESFFGAKEQDIIGRTDYDFVDRELADAFRANDLIAIAAGKATMNEEEITFADDGHHEFLETIKMPVLENEGVPLAVLGIGRNITERKQAEAEILRMNEELERRVQERTAQLQAANEELESFSYSVSHDLRGPLRGIDGFSRALLEDHQDRMDETGRHYLTRIRTGTQRMGQLIDDLLKLSRVNRSEMDRMDVDVSSLCRKVLEERALADPARRVEFSIQPGLLVRADRRLLLVVLENLLGNAWKFTSKSEDAQIKVGATRSPDGARAFFVRDNGAGFDMAYSNKLFNAFQRLHTAEEFEGTGIGLAIVQRIIHRHGGQIWAEAEPGKGATFFFTLPERGTS